MQVFNGQDVLELKVEENTLKIFLNGAQVKIESLETFKRQAKVIQNPDEVYALELDYVLPEKVVSLAHVLLSKQSRTERLQLAQKLPFLSDLVNGFRIPYLHPENLFVMDGNLWVGHFGVLDSLAPTHLETSLFLQQYKALVLAIVEEKVSFEECIRGGVSLKNEFSTQILECEDIKAVTEVVNQELIREIEDANRGKTYVSKGRHRFLISFSVLAVLGLGALGIFAYTNYQHDIKESAIVQAQSDYLTTNYNQTLTDLGNYSPTTLPNTAKYVLAASSVELSSLTEAQKQAVMNNLSVKSDDNTLNYWIYTGRGNFNEALNLAKNLGDNTLTYLAYYNLYEATKLNTSMSGSQKQSLLNEYSKQIESLGKMLGLNK